MATAARSVTHFKKKPQMDTRTRSVKARKDAPVTPVGEQAAFLRNILESSTEYSVSLLEASLVPLVTIGPEGKITDVNEGSIIRISPALTLQAQ